MGKVLDAYSFARNNQRKAQERYETAKLQNKCTVAQFEKIAFELSCWNEIVRVLGGDNNE